MKILKGFFLAVCALALTSCGINGQTTAHNDFGSWDTNQDDMIEVNEFSSFMEDDGIYNNWDLNENNTIEESEWNTGIVGTYPDLTEDDYGVFDDWDADDNDYLDNDELFGGTFNAWDDDANGYWDNNEYDAWYNDGIFE